MKEKISTKSIIFLFVLLVGIFLLNFLTPMFLDDCDYAVSHSLKNILADQYNAYFNTNGRVISHFIVQVFAGILGKNLFNFINPLMYIICILLIARLSYRTKVPTLSIFSLLIIFSLCWFILPDQFVTNYMISGSLNYLWATVFILAFICFFMLNVDREFKIGMLVLIFLLSFFAGAFVEIYSVCVLPAFLVWIWYNKLKINKFIVTSISGFSLGAAFVILAPANFQRRSEMMNEQAGIIQRLFDAAYYISINYLWFVLVLLLVALLTRKRWNGNYKQFFKDNIFYFTAIIFSLAFIALSGALYERTFFAIYIFTIILIIKWLRNFSISIKTKKSLIVSLSLILICSYVYELNIARINYLVFEDIVEQMQISDKNYIVQKHEFLDSKNSYGNTVLGLDSCSWRNVVFTNYHHVDKKAFIPETLYDYINDNDFIIGKLYTEDNFPYYIIPIPSESNDFSIDLRAIDNTYIVKSKIRTAFSKSSLRCIGKKLLNLCPPMDNKLYTKVLYKKMPKEITVFSNSECELFSNKEYSDLTIDEKRYIILEKERIGDRYEDYIFDNIK